MSRFHFGLGSAYDGVGGGNDIFTKSLLHFDGSVGSTSYPDTAAGQSPNLVWTANGNSLNNTFVKFGSAALHSTGAGTTRYASTPNNAVFNNLGTTPFVFDCWLAATAGGAMAFTGIGYRNELYSWNMYVNGSGLVTIETPALSISHPTVLNFGTGWHHVAGIFSATQMWVGLDGVLSAPGARSSLPATNGPFLVGSSLLTAAGACSVSWVGFIDEVRLSIGTTRGWTTNFTPPSAPY